MLAAAIKTEAARLGFDLVGIAPAVTPAGISDFVEWIAKGYAGGMEYLPRREEAYKHPRSILAGVRSVVMLGLNYQSPECTPERSPEQAGEPHSEGPPRQPVEKLRGTAFQAVKANEKPHGQDAHATFSTDRQALVSQYARGATDYHDLIRGKLTLLADYVEEHCPGCLTRGVVDTAPLLERDFARRAGLGWFGKNTLLLNKRIGSWFFLAGLLVDIELEYDVEHSAAHCGTCTRCLDACPTDAFVAPYVLDARKCISYLTIEHRGPIPLELREGMGAWVFGCDVCQDVCPWNRKAPASSEPAFEPRADSNPVDARELLALSEEDFRRRFWHTPLARPKRAGLLRNAAIALGNSGDANAVPALAAVLDDDDPVIRGAAAWALGRLGGPTARLALTQRLECEETVMVREELTSALSALNAASLPGAN